MPLTLLPAVDVADGRAVRLQDQASTATASKTISGDPREVALGLQADGAEWIHLVDLDAAFRRGSNATLLESVVGELDVKVELSGGIHDDASLDLALSTGCERVNLSTEALLDPEWCARAIDTHGHRIAVSLDTLVTESEGATEHRLVDRGSTRSSGDLWTTVEWLDQIGCARYVVTDVSRDGMLSGPNVELYRAVTSATRSPVIASGGVSSIEDLRVLADLTRSSPNLEGVVVGQALHDGRFTMASALEALQQHAAGR